MPSGSSPWSRHASACSKESLLGLVATLKVLLKHRDQFKRNLDVLYDITVDEFSKIDQGLMEGVKIDKVYSTNSVDVNYQDTWKNGHMG